MQKTSRWLIDYRNYLALLSLLLLFFMAYGMKNLYFDTDYKIFFNTDIKAEARHIEGPTGILGLSKH